MNPVRGVSEAASRVDQHRARLSLAGVVFGQRTQYLLRRDLTGGGVEVKAGDAVPLFVDETAAAVARVKREMARFVVSARLPAVAEREGAVFFDTVKVERARAGLSALNRHDEKVSLDILETLVRVRYGTGFDARDRRLMYRLRKTPVRQAFQRGYLTALQRGDEAPPVALVDRDEYGIFPSRRRASDLREPSALFVYFE